jgi:hypothetical protein
MIGATFHMLDTTCAVRLPISYLGYKQALDKPILRRLFQVMLVTVMQGTLLFAAAGRLDWLAAWVYLGLNFGSVAVISLVMMRLNPGLIAERSQVKADAKVWDRLLVKAINYLGAGVYAAGSRSGSALWLVSIFAGGDAAAGVVPGGSRSGTGELGDAVQ